MGKTIHHNTGHAKLGSFSVRNSIGTAIGGGGNKARGKGNQERREVRAYGRKKLEGTSITKVIRLRI